MGCRFVVTLPPGIVGFEALRFAGRAREGGAQLLELRTDLHAEGEVKEVALSREIPLLVAERGRKAPQAWVAAAAEVDRPLEGLPGRASVISHHAEQPLTPKQAVALWSAPIGSAAIKHVEPLGTPKEGLRLLETQRRLLDRFGAGRVTVLAMGPLALPFRALLAKGNALEYLAVDEGFQAALGQRFLADAQREREANRDGATARRGILGSGITGSRSPLFHQQPFDRIDIPPETDLGSLIEALRPFYDGFAVTSPFKKAAAQLASAKMSAVNTLIRAEKGWQGENTDVDGALAVLAQLRVREMKVLGDGGVTTALGAACKRQGVKLEVIRRRDVTKQPISGTVIWTWPASVEVPKQLRFARAKVAVIAYGTQALALGREIRKRGGAPVSAGNRWFSAQAHRQARLWNGRR
jgi:shikimate 5-dehydrogenase